MRRHRGWSLLGVPLLVAGASALLLTACSSGPPDIVSRRDIPALPTETRSSPAQGAASPSATPVDRTDLLAVYRAWWKAVEAAFASGDPDHPDLARYGGDPILGAEQRQIRTLREQGIVQRTMLTLQPRIVHQTGDLAEIADCLRGPARTYYDAVTGQLRAPRGYDNESPTTDALLVSAHRRGGYWFVIAATNEGVQPC
jgi:hypothetical protein